MLKAVQVHYLLPMLLAFFSPAAAGESVLPSPVPSLSAAPAGTFPSAQLQDILDKTVVRGIPGVVLGVATPQGAWFAASGVADISGGEAMTPLHALRIAQASETFTAALIWSLVEDRRLHLDDTVDTWLFPQSVPREDVLPDETVEEARSRSGLPRGDAITVRMLLNHTSGLADHTESARYVEVMGRHPSHRWSAAEVLAIARTQPLKFVPGTGFAYSSTNDYLLGLIAEAVTRRPLERLVRDRLFSPAGMARSSLTPSGKLPRLGTPGYAWLDGRHEPSSTERWSFSGEWAAGGATSTSYDMLAWASRLAGGKVLRPRTLEEAWTVESPSMMAYGFEATRNTLGYRRVGRTGVKPGTTTDLLIYPDKGWAMFIGFNVSDSRSAPTLSTRRIIREVREAAEQLLGWNSPPTYATTVAKSRAAVEKLVVESCAASAMVGFIAGGRVVWSEGFGFIDRARGIPATADTLFAIGSTSKLFAAMAVMKLVDQGKVDLDAPLVRYLPDFRMASPDYRLVTVRMLLDHSAGFPGGDYRGDTTFAPQPDFAAQVQQSLSTERLKYTPGEMANYCNDCFTMVEPLVAAVARKPYARFVEDEILSPLGATRTRYAEAPFPDGSYAPFYPCAQFPPPVLADLPDPQVYTNSFGAGGLYASPNDMARVSMMLVNGGEYGGTRVLSQQAVAEIGRDQSRDLPLNPVPTENYGLGLDWVEYPGLAAVGVKAWSKPGGAAGYTTQYIAAPEEGLAVVVTGASMMFNSSQVAEDIMLRALAERGAIPRVPEPMPDAKVPEKATTSAALEAIAGDYAETYRLHRVRVQAGSPPTLSVTTYVGNGSAFAPSGAPVTGLKLRIDGTFSADETPNVSYRTLTAGGRRYLAKNEPWLTNHYRVESLIGQKLGSAPPLSTAWRNRVGKSWLVVNDVPSSVWLARGTPRFTLYALDDLPGYVFAAGQPMLAPSDIVDPSGSDTLARMFLQVPMAGGRDQNDVLVESRKGEEWIRYGSTVYRPKDGVAALPRGRSTVSIGAEGYAEWRKMPAATSVAITGARAWKLYGSDLQLKGSGSGDGLVTVGSPGHYLMLFGDANRSILLTATSQ